MQHRCDSLPPSKRTLSRARHATAACFVCLFFLFFCAVLLACPSSEKSLHRHFFCSATTTRREKEGAGLGARIRMEQRLLRSVIASAVFCCPRCARRAETIRRESSSSNSRGSSRGSSRQAAASNELLRCLFRPFERYCTSSLLYSPLHARVTCCPH